MTPTIQHNLLDVVILTEDLPEENLPSGSIGAIVDILTQPHLAYMVEFPGSHPDDTPKLPVLLPRQIRPHPHPNKSK